MALLRRTKLGRGRARRGGGSAWICAEHADQLRRIEVDGFKSTMAISDIYEHTLRVLASHLEQLDAESSLDARQCPACANRDNGVAKNARYLLDEIAENAEFQERFGTSPALCVPHFRLVWNEAGSDERTLLRDTQLDAVRALRIDILEHLRKQRAEFAHEPAGDEADSWRRAVWTTAGWPPPSSPAGEPE